MDHSKYIKYKRPFSWSHWEVPHTHTLDDQHLDGVGTLSHDKTQVIILSSFEYWFICRQIEDAGMMKVGFRKRGLILVID